MHTSITGKNVDGHFMVPCIHVGSSPSALF